MKKIFYGAIYSFKEIKNSKIFYSFLIFALILISGSYFVSQTSFINQGRIMVDFSIFAISIFNIFIGIFIGASIVYDDIEKKSIFLTITRPLRRTEYLIGRFLGLASAITFSTIIMMLIFYSVLLIMHKFIVPAIPSPAVGGSDIKSAIDVSSVSRPFILYLLPQPLIIQALFIVIESIFISAAALLFSLITSKALASIFAILVFFIGNVSSRMNDLIKPVKKIMNGKTVTVHQANHTLAAIVHFIYIVLPNFSIFNISSEAAYKISISGGTIIYRIIYGLCYTILLFVIASLIFNRKDIS
ncbi:MAG: hypothetical protein ACYCSB_02980 [bacterium]